MIKFEEKLNYLSPKLSTRILCGNFNHDVFKISDDNQPAGFYEHANCKCITFLFTIHKLICISNNYFSLIDNTLVNNFKSFKSVVLYYDISHHMPIFLVNKSIFCQNEQISENIKFRKSFPSSSDNILNKFRQITLTIIEELRQNILLCYNYAYPIIELNMCLLKTTKNLGLTTQLRKLSNNDTYYTCCSNKIRRHR